MLVKTGNAWISVVMLCLKEQLEMKTVYELLFGAVLPRSNRCTLGALLYSASLHPVNGRSLFPSAEGDFKEVRPSRLSGGMLTELFPAGLRRLQRQYEWSWLRATNSPS